MRKLNKKLVAMIMTTILVCSLSMTAGAASGTFTTYGGPHPRTWEYSLSSRDVASAFYRLTGKIAQPSEYSYDEVEMELTLFCNGTTNVVKTASGEDVYVLETYADAALSQTNGKGSMYVHVEDNLYGYYTGTFYN